MDQPGMLAPQATADLILIPYAVGWSLQLVSGGAAIALGCQCLLRRYNIPEARPLLSIAILANVLACIARFAQIEVWMVSQARSTRGLAGTRMQDVLSLVPTAIAAFATQAFMAFRCWRIVGKNRAFAIVIGTAICALFTLTPFYLAFRILYMDGQSSLMGAVVPIQVWLWGSIVIDGCIAGILSLHLRRMRTGYATDTDGMLDALISLSFKTFAAPSITSLVTAVLNVATWSSPSLWTIATATGSWIPSLYLLSFVFCLTGTHKRSRTIREEQARRAAPVTQPSLRRASLPVVHVQDHVLLGGEVNNANSPKHDSHPNFESIRGAKGCETEENRWI